MASRRPGSPYWNQPSADGANRNIGYILTNTGAFSGSSLGPGALPFYANSNGTAVNNFYFSNTTPGSSLATMLIETAGNSGINIFGWYNLLNPSQNGVIFPGSGSAGSSTVFTIPVANNGFFMQVGVGGPIYFTQSSLNPSGDQSHQHFALFGQNLGGSNPTWYIGMEDLPFGHSTLNREGLVGDYNDMVVRITHVSVPEPGTLLLLGSGLAGLVAFRRRRAATR